MHHADPDFCDAYRNLRPVLLPAGRRTALRLSKAHHCLGEEQDSAEDGVQARDIPVPERNERLIYPGKIYCMDA